MISSTSQLSKKLAAAVIPWHQVCKMLDKVQVEVRDNKRKMLIKFIEQYRDLLKKNSGNPEDSFFPVLRILLPNLDRDRGAYGIKEHKLAELYIRILGLKKNSVDGQKLLNYRKPKSGGSGCGDFADIAYYVLKNRCPEKGLLTLKDVDSNLTIIAESHAAKQQDIVEKSLREMLCKMTASEQKWLIRVLLKDMHLGIGQTTIFNCWHPDAKDFYDVNNSLLKVCLSLRDPSVRLHEIEISLFSAFRPMLAERAVLEKVETQMKQKTFYVETKYDGERSQIHKKGNQYKYFSRNGFDFSTNFGTSPLNGLFTPYLHPLFLPNVDDIILDGEMVGWSQKYKTIVTKGEQMDVKNLKEFGDWQVCFCAFDILYFNGKVLTNLPLSQRLQELKKVISPLEGRVIITSHTEVTSKQDVIKALNLAIDDREEGVILKDPSSVYQPASRRGGWIKVKPEYVESCVPELDLLIIGGYYGTGRRRGIISHFLIAVAEPDPEKNDNSKPKSIQSIGRVGSGYTVSELEDLIARISKYATKKQPSNVFVGREKPDVWFIPEKSCVLEVKAAEIVKSELYKTGFTLRFPRVEKIRSDKSWFDILTTEELQLIVEEANGKLANRFLSDTSESPKKKIARKSQQPSLPELFRPADISNIVKKANLFSQKEFCVISGGEGKSKHQLETLIAEHGGTFTQHPGSQTFCIVSDQMSVRVQNFIKCGQYNIIKPSWLLDSIDAKRILTWNPVQMHFLLPEGVREMNEEYDCFGDSYYSSVDNRKLKTIMNLMIDKTSWENVVDYDTESDLEMLSTNNDCRILFKGVKAFFTSDGTTEDSSFIVTKLKLRLHGGMVCAYLKEDTTHIVTSERSLSNLRPSEFPGKHLVTEEWILKSIKEGKRISERN